MSREEKAGLLQMILSPFVEVVPEGERSAEAPDCAPQDGSEVVARETVAAATGPGDREHAELCQAILAELREKVGSDSSALQLTDALKSLQGDFPDASLSLMAAFRVLKLEREVVEQEISRVLQEAAAQQEASFQKLQAKEQEEISRRQASVEKLGKEIAELDERVGKLRSEREQLELEMADQQRAAAQLKQGLDRAFREVSRSFGELLFKVRQYAPRG